MAVSYTHLDVYKRQARDLSEPVFGHGPGGRREAIHPGNREFTPGDRIARPSSGGGGGSGKGQASNTGAVSYTHLDVYKRQL